MSLPYFPPTGSCFDVCVSLIELYIDRTGLCVSMLYLLDNGHLLRAVRAWGGGEGGWGFVNVVAGDTLRLALAKFLSLFCLHNLPSSDYSFRFLFAWVISDCIGRCQKNQIHRVAQQGRTRWHQMEEGYVKVWSPILHMDGRTQKLLPFLIL